MVILAYNKIMLRRMAVTAGRPGMNPFTVGRAVEDIRRYKDEHTAVLVSVHWGEQYVQVPHARQVNRAHKLIDAGADAILGHHPHCPQSVEVYRGRPIFYSLGNFVFGINPPRARHNIAASLLIDSGRVIEAAVMPVHGKLFACDYSPSFLTGDEAHEVTSHLQDLSRKFSTTIGFEGGRGVLDLGGDQLQLQ